MNTSLEGRFVGVAESDVAHPPNQDATQTKGRSDLMILLRSGQKKTTAVCKSMDHNTVPLLWVILCTLEKDLNTKTRGEESLISNGPTPNRNTRMQSL